MKIEINPHPVSTLHLFLLRFWSIRIGRPAIESLGLLPLASCLCLFLPFRCITAWLLLLLLLLVIHSLVGRAASFLPHCIVLSAFSLSLFLFFVCPVVRGPSQLLFSSHFELRSHSLPMLVLLNALFFLPCYYFPTGSCRCTLPSSCHFQPENPYAAHGRCLMPGWVGGLSSPFPHPNGIEQNTSLQSDVYMHVYLTSLYSSSRSSCTCTSTTFTSTCTFTSTTLPPSRGLPH